MEIALIAAMSKNRVIGKDNKLPWHLPEDLRRFKQLTLGSTVIMGRKTFHSIGRPLPHRDNIVLSRSASTIEGTKVAHSINKAFELAVPNKKVFIIGGADIYKQTIGMAKLLYLTIVDSSIEGDVYFPEFSIDDFREVEKQEQRFSPSFTYFLYERKV